MSDDDSTRTGTRRSSRATRVSAVVVVLVVLTAVLVTTAAVRPAAAVASTNPSTTTIRDLLRTAAVERGIPPRILCAIAYQESRWQQFDADGNPLISGDGGIGIMQVTTIPDGVDKARLKTDITYNIEIGADILITKWGYAPSVFAVIGDGDKRCYEDWFFAVWAYNGLVANNSYPYTIWTHIADGYGLWTGLDVTPVPASRLVNGLPPKVASISCPQPEHWWSPAALPKPVLGTPRVQKRVAAGAKFTVSGTLSPHHEAGAHSVQLRLYWRRGSKWVLRRTVLATNGDSGSITRWRARFTLGKSGRWKVVAYALPDTDHSATTSKPAYVTALR